MRGLLLSAVIMLGYFQIFGQESRKEVCVGFPVGVSILDGAYGDNAARLSEVVSFLDSVKRDSSIELVNVSFAGSASPEGPFAINRGLANKRRDALERYVRERVSIPEGLISRRNGTIAWERLAELVEDSDMPYKEEAVNVLRNVPEFTYNDRGVMTDSRKKHLMDLQYGRTWNYMLKHFFDQIRNGSVILVTVKERPTVVEKTLASVDSVPAGPGDTITVAEAIESVSPETSKPFYMALKTNMLYDAAAIPNIGIEFYLGKNLSIGADWMYAWWSKSDKHRYWRTYGGDIELRWWFGKKAHVKPLTGHHLGAYFQVLTYDVQFGNKGYMAGKPGCPMWDRATLGGGISYGYSLPVARRLNIDFELGVGYLGGKYLEYRVIDDHNVWQSTKMRHWFGPTKVEVSLVWLLGNGNFNSKNEKGGNNE